MDQSLQRACLHCGAIILRLSAQAKYCKESCKGAAWQKADRERNPGKYKERDRAYAVKHAERKRNAAAEWRSRNPEWHQRLVREYNDSHPGRNSASLKLSQMRKRNAAPPWLDKNQIEEITAFYAMAKRLTANTGIKHEVDHIEPVNGAISCGLHVPWNLQVLTRDANRAKRNSLLD
jgi:hypothetical protein